MQNLAQTAVDQLHDVLSVYLDSSEDESEGDRFWQHDVLTTDITVLLDTSDLPFLALTHRRHLARDGQIGFQKTVRGMKHLGGSTRKVKRTQYRWASSSLHYYQGYVLQETLAGCMCKGPGPMQYVRC